MWKLEFIKKYKKFKGKQKWLRKRFFIVIRKIKIWKIINWGIIRKNKIRIIKWNLKILKQYLRNE